MCPTRYDADAACPTWLRCLSEWLNRGEELMRYVQRLSGYGLTGDVREQLLAILWGEGSNGKSTFVNTLLHVLGDEYGGTPPRSLFVSSKWERHPAELMTLRGRRLMIAQETDAGAQLAEAMIKQLTGGDVITGRGMYENFQSFTPTHKLMLCTNYKPEVRGTDYAIWRRLKLIPFVVRFEGTQMDTGLGEKLKAEAPGILAWMVRGCLDWQRSGMQEPEVVKIATKAYSDEQDVIGRFLAECCERGEYETPASTLWETFRREYPDAEMTQTAFGNELRKRGFESAHLTKGPYKGRKTWKGIRLASALSAVSPGVPGGKQGSDRILVTREMLQKRKQAGPNVPPSNRDSARPAASFLGENKGESVKG
jgi:putative DNA primase/helicase